MTARSSEVTYPAGSAPDFIVSSQGFVKSSSSQTLASLAVPLLLTPPARAIGRARRGATGTAGWPRAGAEITIVLLLITGFRVTRRGGAGALARASTSSLFQEDYCTAMQNRSTLFSGIRLFLFGIYMYITCTTKFSRVRTRVSSLSGGSLSGSTFATYVKFPPLVALVQSGTDRLKEKAAGVLNIGL